MAERKSQRADGPYACVKAPIKAEVSNFEHWGNQNNFQLTEMNLVYYKEQRMLSGVLESFNAHNWGCSRTQVLIYGHVRNIHSCHLINGTLTLCCGADVQWKLCLQLRKHSWTLRMFSCHGIRTICRHAPLHSWSVMLTSLFSACKYYFSKRTHSSCVNKQCRMRTAL